MRLEWLEDILAIADTGSLSEAAERRRLTQSAFSRRLRAIEDHIGVELFDRARKPLRLHAAAAQRREQMEQAADRLRRLTADLRAGGHASEGRVSVVSQHALTAALTPSMLEGLQARNSRIVPHLRSENMQECFTLLLARQADIAVVYCLPGAGLPLHGTPVETLTMGRDRLVPVVARGRWNGPDAGGQLPYIAYPADVFLGQVMDRKILPALPATLRPLARAETALTLAAVEMALAGFAIAWVPYSLARKHIAGERLDDLSDALPFCELDVTALRLPGENRPAADEVWSWIASDAPPIG
jgi:DNA-binding transcriptional LysR family regulator